MYTIINNTKETIWWKDGGWYSGDLPQGQTKYQESDHDSNVALFGKVNGQDVFWGFLFIPQKGTVIIENKYKWIVQPETYIVDVWGEGRIVDQSLSTVTGFTQAKNINLYSQRISNGPDRNKPIPNLLPVNEYENPRFPIPDNSVPALTLMGAPITHGTAREMYRVLLKANGIVILYDPNDYHRKIFEQNKGELILKSQRVSKPPFNEISIGENVFVYGFPGVTGHDEL